MNRSRSIRKDWKLIESLINSNSRILDIGCGEGALINQLERNVGAKTSGIEINPELARKAIAEGHNVVQGNAEKDLYQFSDQSFDYVILSQTLQAMFKPKDMLLELLRIGKKAIVSFPNFGHWRIRLQLLINGKMPVTKGLPHSWHETPNIHFFTIKDFQDLCTESKINIEKSIALTSNGKQFEITNKLIGDNLFTSEAIFLLSYQNFEPIKIQSNQKSFISKSAIAN